MFYTQFIKLCNEQKKEPSLVTDLLTKKPPKELILRGLYFVHL